MTQRDAYLAGFADGLVGRAGGSPADRWDVPDDLVELYADGFQHAREGRDAQDFEQLAR
jgi:hypothetical protein